MNRTRLDYRAILEAIWMPVLSWVITVMIVSVSGQPEVVCFSPLIWFLAIPIGWRCASHSHSEKTPQYLLEAGIAGAFWGLLLGIIIVLVSLLAFTTNLPEQAQMIGWGWVLGLLGILISAAISILSALIERKTSKKQKIP